MTKRVALTRILQQGDLNFLLTNRIPRSLLTRLMGRFSKIQHPWIRDASIAVWRFFCDVDLSDARKPRFDSMHDCFIRELRDGARKVDLAADVLVSPCDAIVGAFGEIRGDELIQAKGSTYKLADLLRDTRLADYYRNGRFVTLRITAGMYHRFHAPHDCTIKQVNYVSGDVWNVNPAALQRVDRLFCKNERAIIRARLPLTGDIVTLVPVAAVLVASIRLKFVDVLLHLKYGGPNIINCHAKVSKGDELGWFQHGSTIVLLAPEGYEFWDEVRSGAIVRMGQRLMRRSGSEVAPPLADRGLA